VKAFFTSFQFDLIGLMTRPDVNSLAELKGRKVYFGANGYSSYWPWLKQRFGFTDEMAAPKGPNLATFFNDPTSGLCGLSHRRAGRQFRSSGSTGRGWNSIPSSCSSLAWSGEASPKIERCSISP
jgi:hypothetical protein